jgi:uncharacterized membrane protein YgcG
MKTILALLPLLLLLPALSFVFLFTSLFTAPARAEDMPGREIMLSESEVTDRFFAYLIGLLQVDTCGVVDAEELESALSDSKGKTLVPFERIHSIRRDCGNGGRGAGNVGSGGSGSGGSRVSGEAGGTREISITFHDELKSPVPYQILGYHPGSVKASPTVRFHEG